MNNIIEITKENNNYYLNYKDLKTICYIGANGLTKDKQEGDLKTPIGEFELGIVFGTHKRKDIKIEEDCCYLIHLKDTIFRNETLKVN